MSKQYQFAVTFSRLQLPETMNVQKLMVSLNQAGKKHFIQNQKNVKNNKVNFYRETIFIESIASGLKFQVFQVEENHSKKSIQFFEYEHGELVSVKKNAAMFHTKKQGFQFIWQCSIFQDDESDEANSQSNRAYSELQQNFYQFGKEHLNFQDTSESCDEEDMEFFKRSNSTYQSLFANITQQSGGKENIDQIGSQVQKNDAFKSQINQLRPGTRMLKRDFLNRYQTYSQLLARTGGLKDSTNQ